MPAQGAACCAWEITTAADGTLWMPIRRREERGAESRYGIQAYGPEGAFGPAYMVPETDFEPLTFTRGDREIDSVPFAPRHIWSVAGAGRLLVGVGDRYRFEIVQDGETVRVVERHWEPVAIHPEHVEFERRATLALQRQRLPDWEWDGAEIPARTPAFEALTPAASGEIWVARRGASIRMSGDCVEDPLRVDFHEIRARPCWKSGWILDVFDAEGRYLGPVEAPPHIVPYTGWFFARDDLVVAVTQDDVGTYRVVRYWLVAPG